ncbi:saccharopine dehydrogenase NADP-binding domain-containing protein [Sphingomonas sp.]|uniref:saccharopine dehydrogenase family protein n=1 Tax=Sphingomonas sp. TaxID=28214 RepID=UPI0031E1E474
MDRCVAVYGAGGHTGRFVVSELLRRGIRPIAIGRDQARLAAAGFLNRGVELRLASIEDARSLDRAFAGAAVVINCAGPFLDTADAVAAAAMRSGMHYLDVTAEQASAKATLERFDEPARRAGVLVIPAMGFYGGLSDLLVTAAMGEWTAADEINLGLALDSWHPTSGTRLTGARNTVPRLVVLNGKLAPLPQPPLSRIWQFPAPFGPQEVAETPFSETVLIAHHLRTSELRTFLTATALRDIRDPATPPPRPVDAYGRSAQRFLVEAVIRSGGRERRALASGRDIYAISAPLVCEAAKHLLDGSATGAGARAPGAAFHAMPFLKALAPEPLSIEIAGM